MNLNLPFYFFACIYSYVNTGLISMFVSVSLLSGTTAHVHGGNDGGTFGEAKVVYSDFINEEKSDFFQVLKLTPEILPQETF